MIFLPVVIRRLEVSQKKLFLVQIETGFLLGYIQLLAK